MSASGRLLIVDMEMTCWENETVPPGQQPEVIQVGLAVYDPHTQTLSAPVAYYVRPTTSSISPYCTALTGITARQVYRAGLDFDHVCRLLQDKYGGRSHTWVTWGEGDPAFLRAQCQARGVEYPFGENYLNAAYLYRLRHGLPRYCSLQAALCREGLVFEGRPHDARWDAYNTARLFAALLTEWRTRP